MNAPEQTVDRKTYIGGSDIGAIIGVSKWKTPLDVWLEKTGQSEFKFDPQKEKILARGKRLEPIVVELLAEERGVKIIARNERYADQEYPFMACEVDAECLDNDEHCNVECKTSHPFASDQWGEEDTDEIDVSYAAQAMYGLMITGRRRCIFAVLIGSDQFATYEILRDEETIQGMRAKALQFWNEHVLANVPPEPVNLPDVFHLMKRSPPKEIEATAEIAALAAELRKTNDAAAAAKERAEEIKYAIGRYMLGEGKPSVPGKHLLTMNGRNLLTVSLESATRIDTGLLKSRHPEIAAECSKTSSHYTFRLNRKA